MPDSTLGNKTPETPAAAVRAAAEEVAESEAHYHHENCFDRDVERVAAIITRHLATPATGDDEGEQLPMPLRGRVTSAMADVLSCAYSANANDRNSALLVTREDFDNLAQVHRELTERRSK